MLEDFQNAIDTLPKQMLKDKIDKIATQAFTDRQNSTNNHVYIADLNEDYKEIEKRILTQDSSFTKALSHLVEKDDTAIVRKVGESFTTMLDQTVINLLLNKMVDYQVIFYNIKVRDGILSFTN